MKRNRRTPANSFALVCLGIVSACGAHESLHAQIEAVTTRLQRNPTDGHLYLARGELYRLHGHWDAALADMERAGKLDPDNDHVMFARGRLLVDAGWPRSALTVLDQFLEAHPQHAEARWTRGRALTKLGRHEDAARAYSQALERLETRKPEHYVERAKAWASAGSNGLRDALAGLDEGLEVLGPVVSLQLYAVELELRLGNNEGALTRIDRILAPARRREKWLARRGRILEQAQRLSEASRAYGQALAAIETLPTRHREVPATRALEKEVRTALSRLRGGSAENSSKAATHAANQETER